MNNNNDNNKVYKGTSGSSYKVPVLEMYNKLILSFQKVDDFPPSSPELFTVSLDVLSELGYIVEDDHEIAKLVSKVILCSIIGIPVDKLKDTLDHVSIRVVKDKAGIKLTANRLRKTFSKVSPELAPILDESISETLEEVYAIIEEQREGIPTQPNRDRGTGLHLFKEPSTDTSIKH